jgi:hypothetical protein
MGTAILVDDRYYTAEPFLTRLARSGFGIAAAGWLTLADDEQTKLYVVSPVVDEKGTAEAYRPVLDLLRQMPESRLDSSDIRLVGLSHPISRDLVATRDLHPGRLPTRVLNTLFGGRTMREVFIYPISVTAGRGPDRMAREEVLREIVRSLNRGPGMPQPVRVTLSDGTGFNGVPFSLNLGTGQSLVAQFIVDGETAPRTVRVDDLAAVG